MKFITLIPFTFWIIVLALFAGAWFFGLPGFVGVGIVLFFLLV